jgi:hypothetical protein
VQNGQRLATVIHPFGQIPNLNDHRCVPTMSRFPNYRGLLLAGLMLLAPAQAAQTILVFGDSLSAGYGIRQDAAWPALLAKRLQEKKLDYSVVNASISGETTSGGRARIDAALARHSPQVVIVALGANDGLRGLPVAQLRDNLTAPSSPAPRRRTPGAAGRPAHPAQLRRLCAAVPRGLRRSGQSPQDRAGRLPARRRGDAGPSVSGRQPASDRRSATAAADNVWRGSRHC